MFATKSKSKATCVYDQRHRLLLLQKTVLADQRTSLSRQDFQWSRFVLIGITTSQVDVPVQKCNRFVEQRTLATGTLDWISRVNSDVTKLTSSSVPCRATFGDNTTADLYQVSWRHYLVGFHSLSNVRPKQQRWSLSIRKWNMKGLLDLFFISRFEGSSSSWGVRHRWLYFKSTTPGDPISIPARFQKHQAQASSNDAQLIRSYHLRYGYLHQDIVLIDHFLELPHPKWGWQAILKFPQGQ